MELKKYLQIFKKEQKIFWLIFCITLFVGLAGYFLMPLKYKVTTELDITRLGYQKNTSEYRYDEFYRLQADERFADTVVRWLGSAQTQRNILQKSGGVKFEKLKAKRLSSQVIEVNFLIKNKREAEKIVSAIHNVLNNKTAQLNQYQKDPNWFAVLVDSPTVSKAKWSLFKFASALFLLGIFLALWGVFLSFYFKNEKTKVDNNLERLKK